MAWGTPQSRGTAQNKTSGTSLVLTVANASITVGEIAFIWAVVDSMDTLAGDTTHLSIVDSAGNTWTKVFERSGGVADAHVCVGFWWSKVTTQMTSGSSTVTLTIDSAVVAKAMGCSSATIGAGMTASLANRVSDTSVIAGTAPTVTSGTLSAVARLWWGFLGAEVRSGDTVEDADYTAVTVLGTSGTPINSNVVGRLGYRASSLTVDTYNPTMGQSGDYVVTIMAFDEVSAGAAASLVIPRKQQRQLWRRSR